MTHSRFSYFLNRTCRGFEESLGVKGMDKSQLLKDLKKRSSSGIGENRQSSGSKKREQLRRNYAELISAIVDISENLF